MSDVNQESSGFFTTCPECDFKIKQGDPKCPKCNAEFLWDHSEDITGFSAICPECDNRIDAFIPNCPHCKSEFSWDEPEHEAAKKKLHHLNLKKSKVAQVMKFKCPNCETIIDGKPSHCPTCKVPFAW